MQAGRRQFLAAPLLAAAAARSARGAAPGKLGMPGPYPGRVIEVKHPGSIVSGAYAAEPLKQMMHKGMTELTGAPGWVDAWRVFAQPGDVVGIKVSPVAGKRLCSDPIVLDLIIDGLKQAGVRERDIVVCNRYRRELVYSGISKWIPPGVRWTWAVEAYDESQLGMDGYDPDVYMEIPLIKPGQDYRDAHCRRSYVANFLTKQMNKFINLPVLKHHQSAGVTLALKNFTYGMVNNVNRSHVGGKDAMLNACSVFIPAIADLPVFREKAVLHILDGIKGCYEDGPGANPRYMWEPKTMWFATDPVALDKQGWKAIDARRAEAGLKRLADSAALAGGYLHLQPEHIEFAGSMGLGVYDDAKIDLKKFELA